MNARETLLSRRTIRRYQPVHPGREQIEELIEMAITAPSASNKQPWRFFATDDLATIDKMAVTVSKTMDEIVNHIDASYMEALRSYGDYFIRFKNAPVVISAAFREIAVLSNLVDQTLPEDRKQEIIKMEFYSGLISTSLAIQNLMLYAHSIGLGTSCLTGPLVASEEIKHLLGIPDSWNLAALIAIGFPDESPEAPQRKSASTVLRWVSL